MQTSGGSPVPDGASEAKPDADAAETPSKDPSLNASGPSKVAESGKESNRPLARSGSSTSNKLQVPSDPEGLAHARFRINTVKLGLVMSISSAILTHWNALVNSKTATPTDALVLSLNARVQSNLAFVNSIKDRMSESAALPPPPMMEPLELKADSTVKVGPLYEKLKQFFQLGISFEREVQSAALQRAQTASKSSPLTLSNPPSNKRTNSSKSESSEDAYTPTPAQGGVENVVPPRANGKRASSPDEDVAGGSKPSPKRQRSESPTPQPPGAPIRQSDASAVLADMPNPTFTAAEEQHPPLVQPSNGPAVSAGSISGFPNVSAPPFQQTPSAASPFPGTQQLQQPAHAQRPMQQQQPAFQAAQQASPMLMHLLMQVQQAQGTAQQLQAIMRGPQFQALSTQQQQHIVQQSQQAGMVLEQATQRYRQVANAGQASAPPGGMVGQQPPPPQQQQPFAAAANMGTPVAQQAYSPPQNAGSPMARPQSRAASYSESVPARPGAGPGHQMPQSQQMGPALANFPGMQLPQGLAQTPPQPQQQFQMQPQQYQQPQPQQQQQQRPNAAQSMFLANPYLQQQRSAMTSALGQPMPRSNTAASLGNASYASSLPTGSTDTFTGFPPPQQPSAPSPAKPAEPVDDFDWSEFIDT